MFLTINSDYSKITGTWYRVFINNNHFRIYTCLTMLSYPVVRQAASADDLRTVPIVYVIKRKTIGPTIVLNHSPRLRMSRRHPMYVRVCNSITFLSTLNIYAHYRHCNVPSIRRTRKHNVCISTNSTAIPLACHQHTISKQTSCHTSIKLRFAAFV